MIPRNKNPTNELLDRISSVAAKLMVSTCNIAIRSRT